MSLVLFFIVKQRLGNFMSTVSFFNNYRGHFLLQRFRLSQVVTVWAVEGGAASDAIESGRRGRPQAVFVGCGRGVLPICLIDRYIIQN